MKALKLKQKHWQLKHLRMTNKQYLQAIQSILLELNQKRDKEDVLNSINRNESYFVNHMKLIKRLRLEQKSQLKKNRQLTVLEKLKELVSNMGGIDDLINRLKDEPKYNELMPMFRKLENITESDLEDLILESKIMDMLSEIDEHNSGN